MKIKQKDITIDDVFPEYKKGHLGVKRQMRHVFAKESRPLYCPVCHREHTGNELKLNGMQCHGYGIELIVPGWGSPRIMPDKDAREQLIKLITQNKDDKAPEN